MTDFRVDKGIPVPEERRGGRPRVYRWEELGLTDSVCVPNYEAARSGQAWARRHDRTFVYRKQTDGSGWRVWRTE